ncbi:MAG: TadE/TadG family type IV pilus assembly protein [Xanthobacteraceae bacterium]
MSTLPPPAVTLRHRARLFRRNRHGSAAVEFALVAPLFFALLFAMLEYALMFFAAQVLETATQDTARLVLTGQAKAGNFDRDKFKEEFCKHIVALFNCETGIAIDVNAYDSFGAIGPGDLALPLDKDGNFTGTMRYNPGNQNQIVVVRVFYPWQFYVLNLGFDVTNMAGGKRLLMASFAFRNEPFGAGTVTSALPSPSHS